jgi:hypothetical protein
VCIKAQDLCFYRDNRRVEDYIFIHRKHKDVEDRLGEAASAGLYMSYSIKAGDITIRNMLIR